MNKEPFELHNVHYHMVLRGGPRNDIWGLHGDVVGRPGFRDGKTIMVSLPSRYEADKDGQYNLWTQNSFYRIMSFSGNKEEILKQIDSDIKNDGYEHH